MQNLDLNLGFLLPNWALAFQNVWSEQAPGTNAVRRNDPTKYYSIYVVRIGTWLDPPTATNILIAVPLDVSTRQSLSTCDLRQSSLNTVSDQIITIPRYTDTTNSHRFI
jgi:hypothetical protein